MTYVVAAKHFGSSAIVADMGVRNEGRRDLADIALKSGALFPGCIYGISGHAQSARRFLEDFKSGIRTDRSIVENWTELLERCQTRQPDSAADRFQLVISSRHAGEPELFTFDSTVRGLSPAADFVTIGAGASVLDSLVVEARSHVFAPTMATLAGFGALDMWPAIYTLWLTQHSLSQDYDLRTCLHRVGVSGLFHYIAQSATEERRQQEIIYTFVDFDSTERRLVYVIYKVAAGEHFVRVVDPIEDTTRVCFDSHTDLALSWSDGRPPSPELRAYVQSCLGDDASLFAFGFLNTTYFDRIFFNITQKGRVPGVTMSEGRLSPTAWNYIEEALRLPAGFLRMIPDLAGDQETQVRVEYRSQRLNLNDL